MSDKLEKALASVDRIIDTGGAKRKNGTVASLRTVKITREIMKETCRRLHRLGYYISDVAAIGPRHIEAVVRSWHSDGLSNKTLQNQYSRLKIFMNDWAGKNGLVKSGGVKNYLPEVDPAKLKIKTYTDESKSWSGNGIDVSEWLNKAKLLDERFWYMLLMGLAFGLRKKEMLRIKPWKADKGLSLDIDGSVAKNGRFRSIHLEGEYGEFQRRTLYLVKSKIKRSETLGWPDRTLKQNENRYYKYMAAIGATKYENGVTGHGLRAEFAENQAMLNGLLPPSLGGDKKQMTKVERDTITMAVSKQMGHGRVAVLGPYYGTFRKTPAVPGQIGGRCGTMLISSEGDGQFAGVYINPAPKADLDGKYRTISDIEREQTTITIKVEGSEVEMDQELEEFLTLHPEKEDQVRKILNKYGLCL